MGPARLGAAAAALSRESWPSHRSGRGRLLPRPWGRRRCGRGPLGAGRACRRDPSPCTLPIKDPAISSGGTTPFPAPAVPGVCVCARERGSRGGRRRKAAAEARGPACQERRGFNRWARLALLVSLLPLSLLLPSSLSPPFFFSSPADWVAGETRSEDGWRSELKNRGSKNRAPARAGFVVYSARAGGRSGVRSERDSETAGARPRGRGFSGGARRGEEREAGIASESPAGCGGAREGAPRTRDRWLGCGAARDVRKPPASGHASPPPRGSRVPLAILVRGPRSFSPAGSSCVEEASGKRAGWLRMCCGGSAREREGGCSEGHLPGNADEGTDTDKEEAS